MRARGGCLRRLILLGVFAAAAVLLAWAFFRVRAHGFSAREKPSSYETAIARRLRKLAAEPDAEQRINPVAVTPLTIAEARDHFADHCAICHGNRGDGATAINQGLYPPAPDMRGQETQELSDGELFSIIKNGIRFTGMPGWGGSDEDNWKLVLFIRHLPKLTNKEVEFMGEINHMTEDAPQ